MGIVPPVFKGVVALNAGHINKSVFISETLLKFLVDLYF